MRAPSGICSPRRPAGISGAVPLFVLRPHDRRHRVWKSGLFHDLGARYRMDFQLFELGLGQPAGLGKNVFGHGQFAHVAQQRCRAQRQQFRIGQSHLPADFECIAPHAALMLAVFRIAAFNGHRQRFDGAEMQRAQLLYPGGAPARSAPDTACRRGPSNTASGPPGALISQPLWRSAMVRRPAALPPAT